jgi:hypothetical protein
LDEEAAFIGGFGVSVMRQAGAQPHFTKYIHRSRRPLTGKSSVWIQPVVQSPIRL